MSKHQIMQAKIEMIEVESEFGSMLEEGIFCTNHWQNANQRLLSDASHQDDDPHSLAGLIKHSIYVLPQVDSLAEKYAQENDSTALPEVPSFSNFDNDNEKNICAYLSKKAVQCFLSLKYKNLIKRLCRKHHCEFEAVQQYYTIRNKQVFGITHLCKMVFSAKEDQNGLKQVFLAFLTWFMRQRYMIYLLRFGKMNSKEKYIQFKNKFLLYIKFLSTKQLILKD